MNNGCSLPLCPRSPCPALTEALSQAATFVMLHLLHLAAVHTVEEVNSQEQSEVWLGWAGWLRRGRRVRQDTGEVVIGLIVLEHPERLLV